MKNFPSIAQSAQAIIDIWSEHVAMYANSKREIAGLRSLIDLMRSQVAELATEVVTKKARLARASSAKKQGIEAELTKLQKDHRKYRGCVTKWDRQLEELEQKLEATWDIW